MAQMETIQIEVPSELARRLRPYQSELPRLLEWGLHYAEKETEAKTRGGQHHERCDHLNPS
jgi:hypothetical protein